MLKNIIIVLICLFITNLVIANAVTTREAPYLATKSTETRVYTKDEIILLIDKVASQNGFLDVEMLKTIIECESGFKPRALGDFGHSRGLVQIYDDYHTEITNDMAYNPEFAISFLIKNLQAGKGKMWTCYTKFYSVDKSIYK